MLQTRTSLPTGKAFTLHMVHTLFCKRPGLSAIVEPRDIHVSSPYYLLMQHFLDSCNIAFLILKDITPIMISLAFLATLRL